MSHAKTHLQASLAVVRGEVASLRDAVDGGRARTASQEIAVLRREVEALKHAQKRQEIQSKEARRTQGGGGGWLGELGQEIQSSIDRVISPPCVQTLNLPTLDPKSQTR